MPSEKPLLAEWGLTPKLPAIQSPKTETGLPDYGPEVTLAGTFAGTPGELSGFVGAQGVVLGLGRGVEVDKGEDERLLRCQWGAGLPASSALKVVADQMGEDVQVLRRGEKSYVLGVPESSDLVGRVFYVPVGLADDFTEAVKSLVSGSGSVSAVGDAVVVRDTQEGVRLAVELFDGIQSARGQWVVDVKFIELTRRGASRLGVSWDLSGVVTLSGEILGTQGVDELIAVTLGGLAEASAIQEDLSLVTGVRLHVIEGRDAELQVGETVPVPTASVIGENGRLVTQDFEDIDTGVLLLVGVRTEPNGRLRVTLSPEISSISGYVEGRPIRRRRRILTEAVVDPGGSLIAGGFYQDANTAQSEGVLSGALWRPGLSLDNHDQEQSRIFVFATVRPATQADTALVKTEDDTRAARVAEAYRMWQDEAPGDPAYLAMLLRGID